MPLFTIVIPVHNRAHLIGDCVASVLSQTEQDFDLVVVDNNSTDDLAGALRQFDDTRIRVVRCVKPGPSAARNAGVSAAQSPYISFLDSDDLWDRDVLECARLQIENGAAVVYLTATAFQHGEQPVWGEVSLKFGEKLIFENVGEVISREIYGTNVMAAVSKHLVSGNNALDETIWVGEDFDWAMRHAYEGPVALLGDRIRLAYRIHGVNICKNIDAYLAGTNSLINKCLKGSYPVHERTDVQRLAVRMLVGSTFNIARWGRFVQATLLYSKILLLAIAWGQLNHVIVPEILRAWIKKTFKLSSK